MTLSTYSELRDLVEGTIARTDLNAYMQGWVRTGELFIQNALRVREMEKIDATLTATSGAIALPADFIAVNELRLATDLSVELNHAPSKQLFRLEKESFGTGAGYWDIIGANLYVRPTPSDTQAYWLSYLAKPAALTETTQETNVLFPAYADLYLAATLWQAWKYTRAFDKASANQGELTGLIATYNQQYVEDQQGTGSLAMAANMVA